MNKRLTAATKLIDGLGNEKTRWTLETEKLSDDILKLMGDCLSCASFLSYLGPFDYFYRKKMVYEAWR
jgi:dynein heavy chain